MKAAGLLPPQSDVLFPEPLPHDVKPFVLTGLVVLAHVFVHGSTSEN